MGNDHPLLFDYLIDFETWEKWISEKLEFNHDAL
jgi:hypothetical protein